MSLKTIIIDDEPDAVEILTILLEKYSPQAKIVATASNVQLGIAAILEHKPELVFLDIEMPDGSGFEVVSKTKELDYKLVFTTAYNQYALQAFKVNAIDYLLKPIDPSELIVAFNKVNNAHYEQLSLSKISKLFSIQNQQINRTLSIPTLEGYTMQPLDEILYFVSDSNYTKIILTNGKSILVSKTMKVIEQQLTDDFLRVHNSYIVNTKYIEKFIKTDGGYLVMKNQQQIPISKRRKQEVMIYLIRDNES